jgi:hypothetical protein
VRAAVSVWAEFGLAFLGLETGPLIHNKKEKFATGHRYFVSFAETHCSIVSLPEHTALPKTESLVHFLQNSSSQIKVQNFLFLALWCVLANVSQNCNSIWQRHN